MEINEKKKLLEADIVLCSQLLEKHEILDKIGIDSRKKNQILKEAQSICNHNNERNDL